MLEYLEDRSSGEPRALMCWLHGLGADGYDLQPVAQMLDIAGIQHIFPHAPIQAVTMNGGLSMPAWYDIAGLDLRYPEDHQGMLESARQVQTLITAIQAESRLPIILAGFSQGAVISLTLAAMGLSGLVGVAMLSGYVPQSLPHAPNGLRDLPVFMAHGEQDELIPLALAQRGHDTLVAQSAKVQWHTYMMQHNICQPEIAALHDWVISLLDV
jgi:phospholipase/carboxylesterase